MPTGHYAHVPFKPRASPTPLAIFQVLWANTYKILLATPGKVQIASDHSGLWHYQSGQCSIFTPISPHFLPIAVGV